MENREWKIAFVKAQWHSNIVSRSLEGFNSFVSESRQNVKVTTFDVPGAFEMPLKCQKLANDGEYDAIVAAAFVVDGGIYRHEFVSAAVVQGLMDVQLKTGTPVFSVSLTPHNFQPTQILIDFFENHFVEKGREAAKSVFSVLGLN